ncbi:leucine--tRNA ligase [Candidatus Pacearchaeota archaeon CG10_big_fil_rev_8_21_14_0_10_34_12]|nr:MAG: leucine--tRNA ligase [Candidatus Pacearchaeota archaeon CG10_big_fil_rev_8_21_14_0_10_34_12]
MSYNFKSIEKKWQKKWEEKKVFEPEINIKKKKFFVSFPYPYINLSPHIGHFYTIMRVEAFARYKRLQGFNVLFPQGWHATGSPIISAANRVKEWEPKQVELLKNEGFSEKEIKKFEKPEHWIKVFGKKWREHLIAMGMSIDWRRNFITTSLNPPYDKFIRWQFLKLKEKNLVGKGNHPVVWDPKTGMPVGDHDRVKGEGETPQELCLFKFKLDDGRFIITATLRPDTFMGITNVYVNPKITYKVAEVKGQKWIIANSMIEKLRNQDFNVKEIEDISGKDLMGKEVETIIGKKILVLPATFLDDKYGTGMVHSVPSDSADDLIALTDLQKNEEVLNKYGLDIKKIRSIKPIEVFDTPGIKGSSAQYFLDKYNVHSQNEREKLDKIRDELYKFTFNKSKFNSLYKEGFSKNLDGVNVSEGQEIIKNELLEKGKIDLFYELTGEVVSRSLTKCVVKIVSDQWFLKYGDGEWKTNVHRAIAKMMFYPGIVRSQFDYVVDWLKDWACTREYGLGTRLPFDEKWLIESLSDSTIYMAYYTIAHLVKELNPEELTEEFFDYVFLNKGKGRPKWNKFKKEFDYWYPHDFRNSGKDLVQNHLTFFLFNHVGIFPKKNWPVSIGVNGWVRVDGEKMSKSIGNIIPLNKMSNKFGADASRLTILSGGESLDDPNWDSNLASALNGKFDSIYDLIIKNYKKGKVSKELRNVDKWAESIMNKIISDATGFMEETLFRSASQKIFFDFGNLIKNYLNKTEENFNKNLFKRMIENYLIMLSPFCPHISEEIWEKLGNKTFICDVSWPKADEKKIDEKFGQEEKALDKAISDALNVVNIIKTKGGKTEKLYLYVLPNEIDLYTENMKVIEKRTNLKVMVYAVNDKSKYDPENKSKKVKPGKPGIYIE